MRSLSPSVLLLCLVFSSWLPAAAQEPAVSREAASVAEAAAVPRLMKFGGVVRDAAGSPRSGMVGLTFAIYREQEAGGELWMETQNVELDAEGRYTVLLGAETRDGLPLDLFTAGEPRWLGVRVQLPGEVEQPRILLVSVPYALKAADADTLGGKPASAYLLAGAQDTVTATGGTTNLQLTPGVVTPLVVDGTGTTNFVSKFISSTEIGNSQIFDNGTSLGIGHTNPSATFKLEVNGSLRLRGQQTHQVQMTGAASSGRIGQDSSGFFFASDTVGKSMRVLTNSGTGLTARFNVYGNGNVGIGTSESVPTPHRLEVVGGNVKLTTPGSAIIFPNGTVMSSAATGVGGGTITGVTAGAGLTGGGTAGGVTLAANLVASGGDNGSATTIARGDHLHDSHYARLAAANTFTSDQTITGNLMLTGSINGGFAVQTTGGTHNILAGFSGNTITANAFVLGATISGGGDTNLPNRVTRAFGTVGGGRGNQAGSNTSTVNDSPDATVGGGFRNAASGSRATVSGGDQNTASGSHAAVGGGIGNDATGIRATIAGGQANTASASFATVAGGIDNTASGVAATVGGGRGNSVAADKGTIAGGGRTDNADAATGNRVTDDFGTVGGGGNNQAGDNAGTTDDIPSATVGGGQNNTASGGVATVAGGNFNTADGIGATVSGGQLNAASGNGATVSGGVNNTASGDNATVAGGNLNTASGELSFAAGRRARANHDGAFVWGDSTIADVASTATNQFTVRASGGTRIFSNAGLTAGVMLAAGGGSWASVSDRNMKENFAAVDGQALLAKLDAIPILSWNYRTQDAAIRHLGPMAQDFYAAFRLGEGEKTISTIDANGVALAAVQALYRLNLEKQQQIDQLTQQLRELAARLEQLESRTQQ